ncbi:MAG TPA: YSC84-related protein [Kofleriaceae bacterium]|jgi:lipid-binding SYLF domain-containing protein
MRTLYGAAALAFVLGACATHTPNPATQQNLEREADATLSEMVNRDQSLNDVLQQSTAYAVFPDVGAAGAFVAGGAFGKGILFEGGRPVGYVEVKQGSVGLELGGQTYSELVILRDRYDVAQLKAGKLDIGARASAVILKTGAAATAQAGDGESVFVMPRGGLMAGVTITGQTIDYRPLRG